MIGKKLKQKRNFSDGELRINIEGEPFPARVRKRR
tara:strand:+ start:28223 stop:28327 length:105 start_codon:yes stop_codon:yes gene_type:complete